MKQVRSISLSVMLLFLALLVASTWGRGSSPQLVEAQEEAGPTNFIPAGQDVNEADIPPVENGAPPTGPIISWSAPEDLQTQAPTVPTIDVWYGDTQTFGALGNPQQWINILGAVGGPNPITSLTYSLNGGPDEPLNIGPDERRLYDEGAFNVQLDRNLLPAGANEIVLKASDGTDTTMKTVTVNHIVGNTWPLPYSIDWSSAGSIQNVAQVVDGWWEIKNGELYNITPGFDRLVAIGDVNWTDYVVTVPVTVYSLNDSEWQAPSNGAGIGLIARWDGHYEINSPFEPPFLGWRDLGTLAWHRWDPSGATEFQMRGDRGARLLERNDRTIDLNTTYIFKLSIQSSNLDGAPSTYRFKFWEQGQPEPALWYMESEGVAGEPPTGSMLLVAHQVEASFGDVTITPVNSNQTFSINVANSSNGEIILQPDKAQYNYGERVTVRALGDPGFGLNSWGGDIAELGSQNPVEFAVTQNMNISASFGPAPNPTLVVNSNGNGTVAVSPEKPNYQQGELVTLTPNPGPGYLFAGWSGGLTGANNPGQIVMDGDKVVTASFVVADVDSPVSDDFASCELDTSVWNFVNPVGDGTFQMDGSRLRLTAPEGVSHNIWLNGNRSVRVMQDTEDVNFQIVTKMDSVVTQRFQMQGLLVEQDSQNFLRFEIHHDGTVVEAYAAKFEGGQPEAVILGKVLPSTPAYLRVTRAGESWSFSTSFDGDVWESAGSFDHEMVVNSSGVFSANHNSALLSPPAHTTIVDYFFNSTSPIEPEDVQFNISYQGNGRVTRTPDKQTYACGEQVTLTAVPDPGWRFAGWSGDLTGGQATRVVTFDGRIDATATFLPTDGVFSVYLPFGTSD